MNVTALNTGRMTDLELPDFVVDAFDGDQEGFTLFLNEAFEAAELYAKDNVSASLICIDNLAVLLRLID
jgi:hypothetical protein